MKQIQRLLIIPLLLSVFLAVVDAGATQSTQKPENAGRILLVNVQVFDVNTGTMTPPQDVLIDKGFIAEIGRVNSAKDAERIDCTGMYAIPGLFDCHTHLAELTTAGEDSLRVQLKGFVTRGVLQVRDVGGPVDVLSKMSRRIADVELVGPEMFYTGPMLESGELTWGDRNKELPGFTVAIDSARDVDSLLPELARQGACMIKTFNRIDQQLYRHLVEVALRCSLKIVHDPGEPLFNCVPMDVALDMGVTSIEHAKAPWPVVLKDSLREIHDKLIGPDANPMAQMSLMVEIARLGVESVSLERLRELGRKMREKGAYLCPTLNVLSNLDDVAIEQVKAQMGVDSVPPPVLEMIQTQTKAMRDVSRLFVREFAKDSVAMLVGQDGDDPTATLSEMKALQENGVTQAEILRGATIYPAKWLGVDGRLGSIAVGKQANLFVVRKDPLVDIGNLDSIFVVVQDGRIVGK
jgi:imidazolonepropionase-like amidohydrolase